jgi:hypothetical protein
LKKEINTQFSGEVQLPMQNIQTQGWRIMDLNVCYTR